ASNKHGASDLIVRTDDRVRMRIHGAVVTIAPNQVPVQNREQVKAMIQHMLRNHHEPVDIEDHKSLDFHYSLEKVAHFRIHVMRTNGNFGIVARIIPKSIPSFDELHLPPVIREITDNRNGLVIIAGATGSGKSTTMAAMLDHIVTHRPVHVVTIEDPMEFRYDCDKKGTVCQRQLGEDVSTYADGLSDALREAPDIIVAGEARDKEVIQLALQASETGHLVMATVHATTAVGTMQRLMSSFGVDEQDSIRERLGQNLRAIVVQKLLPRCDGKGRIAALEVLVCNSVIRHYVLEDRFSDIPKAMEEGSNIYGSQSFDQHLQQLVEKGVVEYEEALANSVKSEDFVMRMGREQEV
ncbi:MAG: PilT/PilU family type 4a pilus ATPase, partial [Ghiorsea sp.]